MTGTQLSLKLNSPLIGKVKNDRTMMVWNFFSLTKERVTELPVYDDGMVRIEVRGTSLGVATIWDKEVLIYIASIIQDRINRGEATSETVTFTAHDFFRVTGSQAAGPNYDRLIAALGRLQGTQIITNIKTGGRGETRGFSWVADFEVQYRERKTGTKEMKSVTVTICDWMYRAIKIDGRMLTYHPGYFNLAPLERRLYEIARAHCGNQAAFKINIEKLRLRVGSDMELKSFKRKLVQIAAADNALPEYGISVFDPRRPGGIIDPTRPAPTGRTPLKQWMVLFYRIGSKATGFTNCSWLTKSSILSKPSAEPADRYRLEWTCTLSPRRSFR
jgi:plasmid replication initiation protein